MIIFSFSLFPLHKGVNKMHLYSSSRSLELLIRIGITRILTEVFSFRNREIWPNIAKGHCDIRGGYGWAKVTGMHPGLNGGRHGVCLILTPIVSFSKCHIPGRFMFLIMSFLHLKRITRKSQSPPNCYLSFKHHLEDQDIRCDIFQPFFPQELKFFYAKWEEEIRIQDYQIYTC